ncbi:SigB/SigF/SigG family RNA polymerase sigma factor [Spirillospora sp. NPDC048824]|uniref:SigB/SigF/SigG family RNA polymerase sigma factor n=1 Tax=Spirillospora sp. NPDC048824 TaxID=3364526 RepID=UPI00371DFD7F
MADAAVHDTAVHDTALRDTALRDTALRDTDPNDLTASSRTRDDTMTATPTDQVNHTAAAPRAEWPANRFEDADAPTHTLLEELHRLGPDDPRREQLRTEIITLNATFVRGIARRYAGRGEPLEDLEQVAFMGLVQAINRFDPTRGIRFWGYAYSVVLGEVRRHFRDKTWGVRVPRRLQELRPLLQRAIAALTAELGRSPTTTELADRIGIDQEETVEALLAAEGYRPLSLDAPAGGPADTDPGTVGEHMGTDDPDLEDIIDEHALRPLLARLPERERTIVLLRFYGNQTQTQIATQLGISQMHVSRLLATTLQQLRHGLLAGP